MPTRTGTLASNVSQHSWVMPAWLPIALAGLFVLVAVVCHGVGDPRRKRSHRSTGHAGN